jgi:hypothetical protein
MMKYLWPIYTPTFDSLGVTISGAPSSVGAAHYKLSFSSVLGKVIL